jgi:hypothetical protein
VEFQGTLTDVEKPVAVRASWRDFDHCNHVSERRSKDGMRTLSKVPVTTTRLASVRGLDKDEMGAAERDSGVGTKGR